MAEQKLNRVATVEILGSEYRLTGDDDVYLCQLAQFVDNQFRECSNGRPMYSSGRLGILTCLNIADQLFKAKKEQKEFVHQTLDLVTKSINKLDKALDCLNQNNTCKTEIPEAIYTKN